MTRDCPPEVRELLDKIVLHLSAGGELAQAIGVHKLQIALATQANEWSDQPLDGAHSSDCEIEKTKLRIQLKKLG